MLTRFAKSSDISPVSSLLKRSIAVSLVISNISEGMGPLILLSYKINCVTSVNIAISAGRTPTTLLLFKTILATTTFASSRSLFLFLFLFATVPSKFGISGPHSIPFHSQTSCPVIHPSEFTKLSTSNAFPREAAANLCMKLSCASSDSKAPASPKPKAAFASSFKTQSSACAAEEFSSASAALVAAGTAALSRRNAPASVPRFGLSTSSFSDSTSASGDALLLLPFLLDPATDPAIMATRAASPRKAKRPILQALVFLACFLWWVFNLATTEEEGTSISSIPASSSSKSCAF
mmetsp:Transcript_4356/g.6648  ORF Transcript_4356/g.6648 Transcript_4356/m.6648 type:complete len:293 (-) Transcript_4356:597-1475(-)